MPSGPIVRDKKILYKNPKHFSHIEKTVTIATVLKNFLKIRNMKNLGEILSIKILSKFFSDIYFMKNNTF